MRCENLYNDGESDSHADFWQVSRILDLVLIDVQFVISVRVSKASERYVGDSGIFL